MNLFKTLFAVSIMFSVTSASALSQKQMNALGEQITPNIKQCKKLPTPAKILAENVSNKTSESFDTDDLVKAINRAIAKAKPKAPAKKAAKEAPLKFEAELSSSVEEAGGVKTTTYTLFLTVMEGSNTQCDIKSEIVATSTRKAE